jgi:hypothetical protein
MNSGSLGSLWTVMCNFALQGELCKTIQADDSVWTLGRQAFVCNFFLSESWVEISQQ